MRGGIRFDLTAKTEILDALEYCESQKAGLARVLASCLHEAVDKVREHPTRYPIFYGQYRRYRVDPFKYAIVYMVEEDQSINVVGLIHLMQDPSRFAKRFGR